MSTDQVLFLYEFLFYFFQEFPWVTVNETDDLMEESEIIPVHTADLDFVKLQVYIKTETC